MEIIHVWALAGALGLAALAATLKAVECRHELKLADNVISGLRKELDALNEKHNKSVSDFQSLNSAEKAELLNRISNLEEQLKSHNAQPLNYPKLNNG